MRPPTLSISGRPIGPGAPVYIVAELSANHAGLYGQAEALVRAAAAAGADAIKLQTYTPDTMTLDIRTGRFLVGDDTIWGGLVLHDLYAQASTPWEWHAPLQALAGSLGLGWFSTPFDPTAVEFLESLDAPAYKIASFEIVDTPLLHRVAKTGKPIILSTGMATLEEIDEAVWAIRSVGPVPFALLRTNSAYPAPSDSMHLRTIPALADRYGVPVGLSDHTRDPVVPVAAVALGACIVETHLTLSRATSGPDAAFSLEPQEFRDMVAAIRTAERALGQVHFGPTDSERPSLAFRRSLAIIRDVRKGELLGSDDVRSMRPAGGLPPRHLHDVVGRRAARDLPRGTPLNWDDLE